MDSTKNAHHLSDSPVSESVEATNLALRSKAHDEALDFLAQYRNEVNDSLGFDQLYVKRLKRKLDFYIIPFMLVVYAFNFIDKILLNVCSFIKIIGTVDERQLTFFAVRQCHGAIAGLEASGK